mgnify:CR=1 FL=1
MLGAAVLAGCAGAARRHPAVAPVRRLPQGDLPIYTGMDLVLGQPGDRLEHVAQPLGGDAGQVSRLLVLDGMDATERDLEIRYTAPTFVEPATLRRPPAALDGFGDDDESGAVTGVRGA